jgi:hypothetical protein
MTQRTRGGPWSGYVAIARIEPDLRAAWVVAQDSERPLQAEQLLGGAQRWIRRARAAM